MTTPEHIDEPQSAVADPDGVSVTLSEQRLRVGTEWVPTTRVRAVRRVVSRVVQVPVTVRREELVVTEESVDAGEPAAGGEPGRERRTVITLSEEVPEVGTRVVPYERVTLAVATVAEDVSVTGQLDRERAEVSPPR